jgi:tetratricopeptide (TPR) repeat protein
MGTFGLIFLFSWLVGSGIGRLLLIGAALWYLDNRYFGLLQNLWAPVARMQRIGALKNAVATNPTDIRSMVELSEYYLRSGNPSTALSYVERAIERGENSARALSAQGGALVGLKRYEESRVKLEAALALTPDVGFGEPYLYLLQGALATGGPVEELVERLEQYDSVEVLTRAGQLLAAGGRPDLAKPLFEGAVQNYQYIPKRMRRRARRWAFRAHLGLMTNR